MLLYLKLCNIIIIITYTKKKINLPPGKAFFGVQYKNHKLHNIIFYYASITSEDDGLKIITDLRSRFILNFFFLISLFKPRCANLHNSYYHCGFFFFTVDRLQYNMQNYRHIIILKLLRSIKLFKNFHWADTILF